MEAVMKEIERRISELQKMIRKAERDLADLPEGSLRVSNCREGVKYYHRLDGRENSGRYIRKKDIGLAEKLAQKDYLQKALHSAESEKELLKKVQFELQKQDMDIKVEGVYHNLSVHRQLLVCPIALTDEEFVKRWQEQEYDRKPFSDDYPEYYTNRGERVRSKSEIIIANLLDKLGIPYHYEKPVELDGYGTIYPDFTILRTDDRKELFLEHLGMMDDPEYCRHALERVALYEKNGFFIGDTLLFSYETSLQPLNVRLLEKMLRFRCPDDKCY